jgi:hypothetical protein
MQEVNASYLDNIMPKFENLEQWVKKKYGSQTKAALALGKRQGVISAWITGRNNPSSEIQPILRKLGYDGPWPEESKAAPSPEGLTREEFAEWRGERAPTAAALCDQKTATP